MYCKVTRHVDDCLAKGAKLIVGGPVAESINATGATFYNPSVLTHVTHDMAPFREETFGPIAALMRFETEEEAIAIANDTRCVSTNIFFLEYECTLSFRHTFQFFLVLDYVLSLLWLWLLIVVMDSQVIYVPEISVEYGVYQKHLNLA